MAESAISLPPGFVLDKPNVPDGFVLDKPPGLAEGAGDVVRGAVMPLTALADAPYNAINLGKMAFGAGATALGRPDLAPNVSPAPIGPAVQDYLTKAGVPDYQPQNFLQDLIQRVTRYTSAAMTGSAPLGGIKTLSTAAAPAVSAVGGAATNEFLPGNVPAQVAAELLPSALTGGVSAGRKAVVTPAEINAETIRTAGGNPTVNQTKGGIGPNFVEGVGGRGPGGDIATFKNAQATNAGMGARVNEIASDISPASSPMQAGRSVQTGIDKFIMEFKGRWNALDAKVAQHFTPDDPVAMSNTQAELQRMGANVAGAENSLKAVGSKGLQNFTEALATDSPNGDMRYEAFRKLRTAIGEKTQSANLMDDVSTGQYKALYSAMSKDLEAAAAGKGPEALKAYQNQNNVYRAGMQRIDDTLAPLANKAKPEDAYQAAIAGADKGATTLWGLRRSLPTQEWKDFVGTFVDRMGRSNPGVQSAEGDLWSAQTFLTQWNKISPQAKNALFGSNDTPTLRADLNTVAKAADLITKSGKMYANPSGTAPLITNTAAVTSAVTLTATGNLGLAALAIGGPAGNYITQRMMMNSRFVDWMAKGTSVPADKLPAFTARLMAIGEKANDQELQRDIQTYVEKLQPEMTGVRG